VIGRYNLDKDKVEKYWKKKLKFLNFKGLLKKNKILKKSIITNKKFISDENDPRIKE
jgi:hypothetical protein